MAFEGIIQRIRQIKADIIQNRESDAMRIAFDLSALIKLRIQTSGQNSENTPFVPYTPFTVRERSAKGYQVGYVDFTQTGQFWANVRPRVESSNVFSATVVIEGDSARSKEIVQKAAPKRGNILQASKEEIALASEANKIRIQKYFE
jgi:hypothetical protein